MDPKLKRVPYVRVKRLAVLEQSVLAKIHTGELAQTKNDVMTMRMKVGLRGLLTCVKKTALSSTF